MQQLLRRRVGAAGSKSPSDLTCRNRGSKSEDWLLSPGWVNTVCEEGMEFDRNEVSYVIPLLGDLERG